MYKKNKIKIQVIIIKMNSKTLNFKTNKNYN